MLLKELIGNTLFFLLVFLLAPYIVLFLLFRWVVKEVVMSFKAEHSVIVGVKTCIGHQVNKLGFKGRVELAVMAAVAGRECQQSDGHYYKKLFQSVLYFYIRVNDDTITHV
jgi:hypothetical protein